MSIKINFKQYAWFILDCKYFVFRVFKTQLHRKHLRYRKEGSFIDFSFFGLYIREGTL